MGKRVRGAALRAKKRANAAVQEMVDAQAKSVESIRVTSKPDEQLFVVDNEADNSIVVKPPETKEEREKRLKGPSKFELLKAKKMSANKSAKELKELAKNGKNQIKDLRRKKPTPGNVKAEHDLWEESAPTKMKGKGLRTHGIGSSFAGTAPSHTFSKQRAALKLKDDTIPVEVAHGGQSYHPDKEAHQDIIGEALALELKRKERKDYKKTPISKGLSDETRELLLGSDDEYDTDSDEDDQVEIPIVKRNEKLTRAQRNKQKRHRALEVELRQKKKQKKLLNSVAELPRYQKEMKKTEQAKKEHKELVAQLKEGSKRPLGKDVFQQISDRDPLSAPTLPVALSSELKSSLRSVKPKGSLLTERFESFRDRKMTSKKHVGDQKKIVQGKSRVKVKVKHRSKFTGRLPNGKPFILMR